MTAEDTRNCFIQPSLTFQGITKLVHDLEHNGEVSVILFVFFVFFFKQ